MSEQHSVWDDDEYEVDEEYFECPTCKGTGAVDPLTAPKGFLCLASTECPGCDGTGEI